MPDDERAIRELVATWMAATKAGDGETVRGLMADDVIFMTPGQEPFGKEAFAASAQSAGSMLIEAAADILELQVLGDWAYLRSHIKVTIGAMGGKPVTRAGYTLTILRKQQDGRWLLTRDANLIT